MVHRQSIICEYILNCHTHGRTEFASEPVYDSSSHICHVPIKWHARLNYCRSNRSSLTLCLLVYSDVDAIAGRLIRLPCFVRPLGPSDSISLVLWYRGEDISGTPIYSVDARYTPFSKAQHFVHKSYITRQLMNFTLTRLNNDPAEPSGTSPKPTEYSKPVATSTAHLYVMPAEESDAGLYWCRVDYKWERTTISIVTVNVIGECHSALFVSAD